MKNEKWKMVSFRRLPPAAAPAVCLLLAAYGFTQFPEIPTVLIR